METIWSQFELSLNNLVDKLEGWVDGIVTMLPNFLLALIVMIASIFAARYLRKYLTRILSKFSSNAAVTRLLSSIGSAVFILIMLFVVLGILELDTALTSLLAGAGVAGLAIGLALQEPLVNLFSGIMMSVRGNFKIDDLVETNGYMGTIEKISLRSTILRTFQGQQVVIPNKQVYQNPLTNYSSSGERRVDLTCGVSYGDDLEKAESVAIEAIRHNVEFDQARDIEVFYTEFGNSSINFVLRFWLDQCKQPNFVKARSEAVKALKKGFDENDITIPFPIRTLDFGIKGGERLQDALPKELTAALNKNGDRH